MHLLRFGVLNTGYVRDQNCEICLTDRARVNFFTHLIKVPSTKTKVHYTGHNRYQTKNIDQSYQILPVVLVGNRLLRRESLVTLGNLVTVPSCKLTGQYVICLMYDCIDHNEENDILDEGKEQCHILSQLVNLFLVFLVFGRFDTVKNWNLFIIRAQVAASTNAHLFPGNTFSLLFGRFITVFGGFSVFLGQLDWSRIGVWGFVF